MPKCYITNCKETELIEGHHLIPQSRGGPDEFKVNLCVKHHNKAHYLARSKVSLKLIKNVRLRKIVQIIRLSEKLLVHADTYTVTIKLPTALFKAVTAEAKKYKVAKPKLIVKIIERFFLNRNGG